MYIAFPAFQAKVAYFFSIWIWPGWDFLLRPSMKLHENTVFQLLNKIIRIDSNPKLSSATLTAACWKDEGTVSGVTTVSDSFENLHEALFCAVISY
mgnify:CR=1 FL=1